MNPPALFKMSESSLRLSLLGSTPKEREKSFVARSMLKVYGGVLGGWSWCMVETWRIMESSFGNDVARSALPLAYSDKFGDVISTCFVRGHAGK